MSKFNNNKNIKYVLPVVIAIWGFFFFRLFKACNPDPVNVPQNATTGSYKAPEVKEKENFDLLPIDNDPFLGTAFVKSNKPNKQGSVTYKKTEIPWPNIQYLGVVQNASSKDKVFIVSINGQQQLLKQRETLNDITVVNGGEESITLRFQGKTQTFQKI